MKTILALLLFGTSIWAQTTTTAPTTTKPTGQLIEGIVINYFGGGIPNALVRIESLDAAADAPPLAETRTNNIGDINFKLPKPVDSPVRVRIQKDGYAEFVQEIDPTDQDEPPFIDATLEGAAQITGTIRQKADHKPVPGAIVVCSNGGRELQTKTDADGRYLHKNVYNGSTTLTVHADSFAIQRKMVKVESEKTEVDIELQPEQIVQLTVVTNEDQPAKNIFIEAFVEPMQHYIEATTDDRGKATLNGINPDAQSISLRLNGDDYVYMPGFTKSITLPTTPTPATKPTTIQRKVMVEIAGKLKGTVTDAKTGQPIVGVRIVSGRELRPDMPMIWTSLDGTYELIGIHHGNNIISFQHAQYATSIHQIAIYYGKTAELNVTLHAGQTIGGTVVNEKNKPLQRVWVSADDWKGYATLGLRTITDEDGKFLFSNAPAGDIKFSFRHPGCGQKPVYKTLTVGKTEYQITLEIQNQSPPTERPKAKIEVGQTVPNLCLTTLDGTKYELAELRGKYVFLDCWATWCGPCMLELPNIKALRKATKDRPDFIMIGVSLDSDRDALKKTIEKHQIDWPQAFGSQSGAHQAFETLNGIGIPYTCLIGPDGKILAQDFRGPDIVNQVKKLITKTKK